MPNGGEQKLGRGWLVAIALFKLVKAAALVALGVMAITLAVHDPESEISRWACALSMDPDNRFFHGLLAKVAGMSSHKLEDIGLGTFVYSGVFATEGVGLLREKHWAEYLTILVTISFIPFEIYELVRRATAPRVATIVLNVAAVGYLVWRVRREKEMSRGETAHA